MEEEKGIVIPCKHLSEERRRTKRVIRVKILYREVETRIDCENESVAPITHHHLTLSSKSFKQGSCNPVGCQECKSDIMDYFTTVIAHPNPDGVFADLCTQLNAYLLLGIPDPRVLTDLTRRSIDIGALGTYMRDIIREENPVIEVVSYQICNYMERHNLGQRQGSNDNSEWHVTWLGARFPQPTHPRPCDFKLDKVDGQSLDAIEDFTCPICLKDHVNRSVDAQVDLDDDLVALPCQHIFHQSCISLWLDRANSCPQCRFQLPSVCVAWSTRPNSGFGNFSVYKIEAL